MLINSRFPGNCASCGQGYPAGIQIDWVKGRRETYHAACVAAQPAQAQPARARSITPGAGVAVEIPADARPADLTQMGPALTLDSDQQAVCDHRAGEAVAAAAAGSGKSTVLVERTAALLSEGVIPEAILILTFNTAAAATLRTKLAARIGSDAAGRVRALTYHAFCLALLKRWAPGDERLRRIVGDDKDSEVPSKAALIGKVLKANRGIAGDAADWGKIDERVREDGIDIYAPEAVDRIKDSRWGEDSLAKAQEILTVCQGYADAKDFARCVDFTDMLVYVAQEFARDTERARAAACFGHVMVDEAQDTNPCQQGIARYLGAPARSLLWVGDLRQSIYGFRGAAPALLTDRVAAGATLLPIRTCRRSTPQIVEAGNAIARGRSWHLGGDSVARAGAPQGPLPRVRDWAASDVADSIASDIAAGTSPFAFACLARTNAALPDLEIALTARNVPCRLAKGSGGVWTSGVGRQIRAYLHAAQGRATEDLSKVSNRPLRYLRGEVLTRAVAGAASVGLVAALRRTGDRAAGRFALDIEELSKLTFVDQIEQIGTWLRQDANERAAGLGQDADDDRLAVIEALCDAAVLLGSIKDIEDQIEAMKKIGKDAPAVILGTVHWAKGAEWDHVFVYAANSDMFPHKRAEDGEEEARLFYVATTRAKLTLTYVVTASPSPFLKAMGAAVDHGTDDGAPGAGGGAPAPAPTPAPAAVSGAGTGLTLANVATCGCPGVHEHEAVCPLGADDSNPLAGPTPTNAEIGPDEVPVPPSKYVPVRLTALRALLEPLGFLGGPADRGDQYMFVRRDVIKNVSVRVYTTIPVGDTVSRDAGEDSIRITAIWSRDGQERAVLPREAWVCRTAGWRQGILDRVTKVEGALANVEHCPDCNAPMRLRSGKRGSFHGCLAYPACRGTRQVSQNAGTDNNADKSL